MKIPGMFVAILTVAVLHGAAAWALPRNPCLAPHDARQIVAAQHLIEPFKVMKAIGNLSRADPVSIRLCAWGTKYTYEVILLHREGRLLRVFVDGITGKTVNPPQ